MQHPFDALAGEYNQLLPLMRVRPECESLLDQVVDRLLGFQGAGDYAAVSALTGVPEIWMASSFEREASSDFRLSPAQGDPWNKISVHVPAKRGPFASWAAAAEDAYHLDGLDAIGAPNWSWARACFEGELFNGFGYRDFHHMHSPYLWGGSNIQQPGKYVGDGKFDPDEMDPQLGIVPMMVRLVQIKPALALPDSFTVSTDSAAAIPAPLPAPVGVGGGDAEHNTLWIQQTLNALGETPPIADDGSYGKQTKRAVMAFQQAHGLEVDGFAGPQTIAALIAAEPAP